MSINTQYVSADLIALYEPLFLEMKNYAENSIKLSEDTAYKYFKRVAGNCNKKAIPEEICFSLLVKHLDFKTYEDEATEATEEAYQYENDWGTWLKAREKVGDPNNPMHQKGSAKRKNDTKLQTRLSKEDYESIADIIKTTLLDFVPLLCGNQNLEKKSIFISQFMAIPRTIEEIMSYGESIGANESQVDFIFTYLDKLDLIDEGEGDTYIQKSL